MRPMRNRGNTLDSDRVGRLLVKLSLPAFFGMFVMTLYNVVDTIFLENGVGAMFGMGGASLISRLLGAKNVARAERALGNAISPIIILSLLIMVAGLINPDFWLRLMGASETILPYARDYMTIILVGMLFQTAGMSLSVLIRSEGNAIIPMTGMIIGAISNIIMDAIFIIPLGMGIKGAALATVIAQLISVSFFLVYYFSGKSFLKIHARNLLLDIGILKDILAIGVASFARTLATSLSAIIVNRLLVVYGGDLAVSAFGVVNRIMMFAMMPAMVMGQGLQPILGFNYGAKRFDRALKAVKLTVIASTIASLLVFSALFFSPEPLIRIFTTDTELITLASYAAKHIFFAMYLIGFMMVGSLIFQSIGKAGQSFLTSIARPFLFLIPLLFTLPRLYGLDGILIAFPTSDFLTFLLTVILLIPVLREMRRAGKEMASEQPPLAPERQFEKVPAGSFAGGTGAGEQPEAD